jgi:hypothetical protein
MFGKPKPAAPALATRVLTPFEKMYADLGRRTEPGPSPGPGSKGRKDGPGSEPSPTGKRNAPVF